MMRQWVRPVLLYLLGGLVIEALDEGDFSDTSDLELDDPWTQNGPNFSNHSHIGPRASNYAAINCRRRKNQTSWPQEVTLWGNVRTLCDSTTDGGGWITIQRRTNAHISFFRNWADYKKGFGHLYNGFWIGNNNIHKLTSQGFKELRIDLIFKGKPYFAQYRRFSVASEQLNYKLSLSGYWGTAGDSLLKHNNMGFSTPDRDNDKNNDLSCAKAYNAGWWYYGCYTSNLNGVWKGLGPQDLLWETLPEATEGVRFSEMKVRRL